jgi:hypothetical protein
VAQDRDVVLPSSPGAPFASAHDLPESSYARGLILDFEKAMAACAIAKDPAPYLHPRLSNVEAQIADEYRREVAADFTIIDEEQEESRLYGCHWTGHRAGKGFAGIGGPIIGQNMVAGQRRPATGRRRIDNAPHLIVSHKRSYPHMPSERG